MAQLLPRIGVKDLERELKFYGAIGFEVDERRQSGARISYDGVALILEQYEPMRVSDRPLLDWDRSLSAPGVGILLYLIVPNVDEIAGRLPVGVPRPWPVQDKPTGLRELTLRSPTGYLITFAHRLK